MSLKMQGFLRTGMMFGMILILLITSLLPTASAAEPAPLDLGVMELKGTMSDGELKLTPHHLDNLFDLQSVSPGTSWKRTVRVTNTCSEAMEVAVISCTTKDQDTTLFDALIAEISVDDEILYSGPYGAGSEEHPMTEPQVIRSGESLDFEILVALDSRAGNELQNKTMDSLWDFGAFVHETASDSGSADDGSNGTEGNNSAQGGAQNPNSDPSDSGYQPGVNGQESIGGSSGSEKNPSGVKTGVELDGKNDSFIYILLFVMAGCIVLASRVLWTMRSVAKEKERESNRKEGSPDAESTAVSDSKE